MATTLQTSAGPVLAAIYAALNVAAITAVAPTGYSALVYDDVPQAPLFPYVRIMTPTGIPWDTFGLAGKERTIHVHVFSQYKGRLEAQRILDRVVGLLQYQPLAISGHTTVAVQYEQDTDVDDEMIGGKKTVHKIGQFRVIVQEL